MIKKNLLLTLASFFLCSTAFAVDYIWVGVNGDVWNDSSKWHEGVIPGAGDGAFCLGTLGDGPTINSAVTVDVVSISIWEADGDLKVNSGGDLTANEIRVGFQDNEGELVINGGSVRVNTSLRLPYDAVEDIGRIHLKSGTLDVASIWIQDSGRGSIDIEAGFFLLDGDQRDLITAHVDAGRITAYNGQAGYALNMDYNGSNAGKTTVRALAEGVGIRMPEVFSSNMVLQRDEAIPVWGEASQGAAISVNFAGNDYETVAGSDGKWSISMNPLPASITGRTMTITGDSSNLSYTNIVIGDVWIAGGQSNMEMSLFYVINADPVKYADFYSNCGNPNIRHCRVGQQIEDYSRPNMEWKSWSEIKDDDYNTTLLSAVAYFFARDVEAAHPDVPVGIISCNYGGTPIEAWFDDAAAAAAGVPYNNYTYNSVLLGDFTDSAIPGILYDNMVSKIAGFGACGFLWYQGSANSGRASEYHEQLSFLISSWRDAWGQGELPFLIVQLPLIGGNWTDLRNAQLHAYKTVNNTGLVTTIDIPQTPHQNDVPIHPYNKEPIGERLALLARDMVFNDDVIAHPPVAVSKEIQGSDFYINFVNCGTGLVSSDGGAIEGFFLSSDGVNFVAADTVTIILGDRIKVSRSDMPAPTHLRYASDYDYPIYQEDNQWTSDGVSCYYSSMTNLNLVGESGIPASPFNADDLPLTMTKQEIIALAIAELADDAGATGTDILPEGDADGDGILNLVEYALGGNLSVAGDSDILPTIAESGNDINFSFTRDRGDLYYYVEYNTGLSGAWTKYIDASIPAQEPASAILEEAVINMDGSNKLFVRLRVSDTRD